MSTQRRSHGSIKSTAAIAGHPIHPILVPFPIAFLSAAIVTDIVYTIGEGAFWAEASWWLILAGLVTGAVAAVAGLTDFLTKSAIRDHRAAWVHFLGNAVALTLTLINLLSRDVEAVPTVGLILSIAVGAILMVTGWYGGELSYRHKVGVIPSEDE